MTEVTPLQQSTPKLGRLVVVGLGLIGGSFAKGLRSKGLFREVVGVDRDAESCRLAVEFGVVDRCEEDLGRACVGADVIQLAVPILAMERVLADLANLDLGKAVLTDVGSAKGNIVRAARAAFGGMPRYLVPGHPIAGSEQSGVTAAKATLFRRHKVIVVKPPRMKKPLTRRGLRSVRAVPMVKLRKLALEVGPIGPGRHRQAHYKQGGQHDHAESRLAHLKIPPESGRYL